MSVNIIERYRDLSRQECERCRKESENKSFRLVGLTNVIGIFPEFVLPVFICEQDGKMYMQEGDADTLTLNSFFNAESYGGVLKRMVLLDNINTNDFMPPILTIDSKPIFAFQISEEDYFIGYAEEMKKFLQTYPAGNEILKAEINDFLTSCENNSISKVLKP